MFRSPDWLSGRYGRGIWRLEFIYLLAVSTQHMKTRSLPTFPHLSAPLMLVAACFFALASCKSARPTTTITGSWKDPEAKTYKTFLVASLNKKLSVRSSVEGDISKLLKKQGVDADKSMDVLGKEEKIETDEEKKAAVEKIHSMKYDAIVVVSVVRHTDEKRFVPGKSSYAPANVGVGSGYYNPATGANQAPGGNSAFGMYYMDGSTTYNTPGYYVTDQVYFLRTSVFDLKTSKLIWSAESESFYAGDIAAASRDFSTAIVTAIKQAGIIKQE
jgi:hypothetical protein